MQEGALREDAGWKTNKSRRQKESSKGAQRQGARSDYGQSSGRFSGSRVFQNQNLRSAQNGSVSSFGGWKTVSRNRKDTFEIVKLDSLDDWESLQELGSPEIILAKLNEFKSEWIGYFHENSNFDMLNILLDVLNRIDDKFRWEKVGILKELFTPEHIKDLSEYIASRPWSNIDAHKILKLIRNLRQNIQYAVCYEAKFRGEKYVECLRMLVGACTDLLLQLSEGTEDDENFQEEISNFMNFSSKVNVELSVYPYNFQEPLTWEPNKIEGPYANNEHYIRTHFNLIKEDFQIVLRDGISSYVEEPTAKNWNLWHYEGVTLTSWSSSSVRKSNALFYVQFPKQIVGYLKTVPWKTSRRFMFGSLVVLSPDLFDSYYLAIVETMEVQKDYPHVFISFLSLPPKIEDQTFVLVEPRAFFPPCFYSMLVLKLMLTTGVPFERYIVKAETTDARPAYLNKETEYIIASHSVKVCEPHRWPPASTLGLNDSQRDAFIRCVTSEFALIQGPPGTGKTFLAVKLLCTLLENKSQCHKSGPILVVAFKNHSLDQMLERLVKNGKRVVRIGGQSKSELLKDRNANLLRYKYLPPDVQMRKKVLMHQVATSLSEVNRTRDQISLIQQKSGIIRLDVFKNYGVVDKRVTLSTEKWLLKCLFNQQFPIISEQQIWESTAKMRSFSHLKMHQVALKTLAVQMKNLQRKIDDPGNHGKTRKIINDYWRLWHYFSLLHAGMKFLESGKFDMANPRLDVNSDLFPGFDGLAPVERWTLYYSWEAALLKMLENDLRMALARLGEAEKSFHEVMHMQMYCKLKEAQPDVIGITTTGAASHHVALSMLGPKIVLIEEAAEVLETHIVTSLSTKCEHLILIGDHQQLKPTASSDMITREGFMNVSLFERMILNDIEWVRLSVQHRMRPEIAALISPSIYADLENSPSTAKHPDVRGMMKNVFFFSHDHKEEYAQDSKSKCNPKEALMVKAVFEYLLKQEYEDSKITILSTYQQQDVLIKSLMKNNCWNRRVTVTTVDNYQGEENDIVLLSLVRSNKFGEVGFLKEASRVCVGLSRAKNGLYIFGNISCLLQKEPTIWTQIYNALAHQHALGEALPLECTRHGNVTYVEGPKDFHAIPNGGCTEVCALPLECGHTCDALCHGYDQDHEVVFVCKKPCLRKCNYGHRCKSICSEDCPDCLELIERTLPCGHTRELRCHLFPERKYCRTKISMNMKPCGHVQDVSCRELAKGSVVNCKHNCSQELPCGHVHLYKCYTNPEGDLSKVVCTDLCGRGNEHCPVKHLCRKSCGEPCGLCEVVVEKNLPCGHAKTMKCHESPLGVECDQLCQRKLDCGHTCCGLCFQPCDKFVCRQLVSKTIISCGHKIEVKCHVRQAELPALCLKPCESLKSCGHTCPGLCKDNCDELPCVVPVPLSLPCGHRMNIPCHVSERGHPENYFMTFCKNQCDEMLPCHHRCAGKCGTCFQGKFHHPCLETCRKPLICGHECANKCGSLYHSCLNKKCLAICHKEEVKFRQNAAEIPWFKHQNIMNTIKMELQKKLLCYLGFKEFATQFEKNALLLNMLTGLRKSLFEKNGDRPKTLCEEISFIKSSIMKAEFLFVYGSLVERLEKYNLSESLRERGEELTQNLAKIANSRETYVSVYEIIQLQQIAVWTSMMIDYYAICELCRQKGKTIEKPANLDRAYSSETVRVEAYKRLIEQVKATFNVDTSISSPYVVDIFPLSAKLAAPVYHHFGDTKPAFKTKCNPWEEKDFLFDKLSSTCDEYSDQAPSDAPDDERVAEIVEKLETLGLDEILNLSGRISKTLSDDDIVEDIDDRYYDDSDD